MRDEVMDFVDRWSEKAEFPVSRFITWLGISCSKFYSWGGRYGNANEHNGRIPRDYWLLDFERQAIIRYYFEHPLDGYRRLAFMMIDNDIAYVSPSSVYRVLSVEGLLKRFSGGPSHKGAGFEQPLKAHEHWHVDISNVNICATFYYLCSVLDGVSRYIVHWDIRESMKEFDVELILQRALERYPEKNPRVISDNGSQFISRDFREFIRLCGMKHVKTSPYYPQSNGKIERWHQSLKKECIRHLTPLCLEDARGIVSEYVDYYNHVRLHSGIGYVAPIDKLMGREVEIFRERDRKLEAAREERRMRQEFRTVSNVLLDEVSVAVL